MSNHAGSSPVVRTTECKSPASLLICTLQKWSQMYSYSWLLAFVCRFLVARLGKFQIARLYLAVFHRFRFALPLAPAVLLSRLGFSSCSSLLTVVNP